VELVYYVTGFDVSNDAIAVFEAFQHAPEYLRCRSLLARTRAFTVAQTHAPNLVRLVHARRSSSHYLTPFA